MENNRGRKKKASSYDSPFAARLRGLLEDTRTTQPMLAEAIGVSRQAIGQWKDGNTLPDIVSLGKIADYFKVSADYLLGRSDIKSIDPLHEIETVCNVTKLSENAVKELIEIDVQNAQYDNTKEVISEFITHNLFKDLVSEISRTIHTLNTKPDNTDKRWTEFADLMNFKYNDINDLPETLAKAYAQSADTISTLIIDDIISDHTQKHILVQTVEPKGPYKPKKSIIKGGD